VLSPVARLARHRPSQTIMPETESAEAEITPDVFQPSKGRIGFAALVALGAFFIPQEIPLEYYPLNDPSSGLQYIEITCAANVTGTTEIFLDTGRGINELDKISWPIGPSEMAFTYTFPLADTPLLGLRLDPLDKAGELRITNFRLINRKGEEIRRITRDHLVPVNQIDRVEPLEDGWKIITSPGASDPFLRVNLDSPTLPVGMNVRNLQRCLLSTGYLAMMLTILLLAVFFRRKPRTDPKQHPLRPVPSPLPLPCPSSGTRCRRPETRCGAVVLGHR
jgi:hypothetical protein